MSPALTDITLVSVWLIVAGLLAACIVSVGIWRRRSAAQPPPLGIVMLLSRTKPLEGSTLAAVFSHVTGTAFQVIPPPAGHPEGNAVLGGPSSFLVQAEGELFLVNSVDKPYVVDLKAAGYIVDCDRLAAVLKEHQAWLSVEILHPEAVSSSNYRIVGQVVAELLSTECLALLHPESRKVVSAVASDTHDKLRAAHPINAVFGFDEMRQRAPGMQP